MALIEAGEGETFVIHGDEHAFSCEFPEGCVRPAVVRVDLDRLTRSSRHGMSEFGIDFDRIIANTAFGSARRLSSNIDMGHTFMELYNLMQAKEPNIGYLRFKAFEILLLDASGPNAGLEDDDLPSSLFSGRMQVAYRA